MVALVPQVPRWGVAVAFNVGFCVRLAGGALLAIGVWHGNVVTRGTEAVCYLTF